jgi:hypothetical protein
MSKSPTKVMRRKSVKPRTDSQRTKEAFLTDLRTRARVAVDILSHHISQRRLEHLLGLSQGYLSRLRARRVESECGAGRESGDALSGPAHAPWQSLSDSGLCLRSQWPPPAKPATRTARSPHRYYPRKSKGNTPCAQPHSLALKAKEHDVHPKKLPAPQRRSVGQGGLCLSPRYRRGPAGVPTVPQCPATMTQSVGFAAGAQALANRLASLAMTVYLPTPASDDELVIPRGTTLKQAERLLLTAALRWSDGRRATTAQLLGVSRRTLYNKLSKRTRPDLRDQRTASFAESQTCQVTASSRASNLPSVAPSQPRSSPASRSASR